MRQLLVEMRDELKRFMLSRQCDPAEVDDLLQDLFVKLTTGKTGPVGNPRAYLYQMANNLLLDRRRAQDRATVFVSLHSFTPVLNGHRRPWEIGVLHDGHRDDLALRLLNVLGSTGRVIGDNEPYAMDSTDYTVPAHAFSRDLPYVEIEVRQDLLAANPEGLARLLGECLEAAL